VALPTIFGTEPIESLRVLPIFNPGAALCRQSTSKINLGFRICIRAGGVVKWQRSVLLNPVAVSSFRKREFALGHLHISPTAGKVPLSRRWVGRDRANLGERHFGLRHFTAQFGLGTRSGVPDING
jgi:hypothetical protein